MAGFRRVVGAIGVVLVSVSTATATPITVAAVGWDRECFESALPDGSCSSDGVDTLNLTVFDTTPDPNAGTFDVFHLTLNGSTDFDFLNGSTLAPGAATLFRSVGFFPITSVQFNLAQIHASNPGILSILLPDTLTAPNTVLDDSSGDFTFPDSTVLLLQWEARATDVPPDTAVPEPATLVLLGAGTLVGAARKRKRQAGA